jgi:hypothetical protein
MIYRPEGESSEIELYSIAEVADLIRRNKRTVWRYIKQGVFTTRTVPNFTGVPVAEVQEYLAEHGKAEA